MLVRSVIFVMRRESNAPPPGDFLIIKTGATTCWRQIKRVEPSQFYIWMEEDIGGDNSLRLQLYCANKGGCIISLQDVPCEQGNVVLVK